MEDEFASFLAEIETLETKAKKTETNEDETRPAKKKKCFENKKVHVLLLDLEKT